MKTIWLIVEDGRLHTLKSDIADAAMARYYSGNPVLCAGEGEDCDTIAWPLVEGGKKLLAQALYDAREMGLIPDVSSVLLPNGEQFTINAWLF